MSTPLNNEQLLEAISPEVEGLVHRHYDNAHTWQPYELVPWDDARSYLPSEPWNPNEYPLDEGVRSALFVHLLTEDNLPYYTHVILDLAPDGHPLNEWTRRWTAEEGRHSMVIRDWILATRAFDPGLLEEGRMAQMSGGKVPEPESVVDMLAYTAFQELATRVAHSNTGRKLGKERGGAQVMAHVAADEQLHYAFYRDAAKAALEVDPSGMVIAISKQLRNFRMPGTGIPDFKKHEAAIAAADIFSVQQLLDVVVVPTLDSWRLDELESLTPQAERARDQIHKRLRALARVAGKASERTSTSTN